MIVLPDTSVWSLALRRRQSADLSKDERQLTAKLAEAIQDGRVAMIGPIRQELLSGLRDRGQFEKLRNALHAYSDEPLETVDYEEAARFHNACRSRGVECGPVDILICAIVARRKWQILANDDGLARCWEIIRGLQVTHEKTT